MKTIQRLVIECLHLIGCARDAKTAQKESKGDNSAQTPDRGILDDIKARFDMVAYAQQQIGVQAVQTGNEYRLPGNGGFLINPEKGVWYHHSGQEGGDALDLVGYWYLWNRLE